MPRALRSRRVGRIEIDYAREMSALYREIQVFEATCPDSAMMFGQVGEANGEIQSR